MSLCIASQMRRPTNVSSHALPWLHLVTTIPRGPEVRANCSLANRLSVFFRRLPRTHDAPWHVVVFTPTIKRDCVQPRQRVQLTTTPLLHHYTTQLFDYYKSNCLQVHFPTSPLDDYESNCLQVHLPTSPLDDYESSCLQVHLPKSPFS